MPYDIKDFLEIRTAVAADARSDGSAFLVGSNLSGSMQIYRADRGGGMTQLTDGEEPAGGGRYLPGTNEFLFSRDEGGNERHQIYRTDDAGGPVRALTSDPGSIHALGDVSRDGRVMAYYSNRRNDVDFDVIVHDLSSGEERTVFSPGGWCTPVGFSPDGTTLAVARHTERNMDNDLYLVDLRTGDATHISPHEGEASFGRPWWIDGGAAFLAATDHGTDHSHIARFDIGTAQWRPVIERESDLSCTIDDDATVLLVHANEGGYSRMWAGTPGEQGWSRAREIDLPGRGVMPDPRLRAGGMLMTYVSAGEPGDVWWRDHATGALERITTSPNPVPSDVFVEPELVDISSFDGERIAAFVYRPARPIREPAPVIVWIHGGPESQFRPGFNGVIQYLTHRGFAVVAPNVRGSSGYGRRFGSLDDVRRRLDSVRDLAAIHAWFATGGFDPTRAALMGGSYGGYMVLAGLAFQPDLWAAGVDIVGMSSLVTFLENTSAYRRVYREREYGSLEHDRDFLLEASPITHVDAIRAPLQIIHGANDPRVPLGEAEQLHDALRARAVPCDLLVYPDEGHGLAKLRNRLDAYPRVAAFLEEHLTRA